MRSHLPPEAIPDEVGLEHAPCPCGCPPGDDTVLAGQDRLNGLPGRFTVVRCSTCGLKRTDPRPDPASMGYYYPADYDPYTQSMGAPAPVRQAGWKAWAKRLLGTRSTHMPDVAPGRLLEIGCAAGAHLRMLADRGWRVQGLEPSAEAAEFARSRGFEVANCELEAASYPAGSLDMIIGWMVMEHLHAPVECLKKMHDWVAPDGWLVFSVPNAGSYELKLFRDAWFALQLPTHTYHYEPASLASVLAAGGWKMERVFFQRSNANLVYSAGYRCRDLGWNRLGDWLVEGPLAASEAFRLLTFPYAWLAALFRGAGRMTVWARKI